MLNARLLHKIREKHPEYSIAQIKTIILGHLNIINTKLSQSHILNLKINKLGTIHTHGNTKDKIRKAHIKRDYKRLTKYNNYSDKNLLF